MELAPAELLVWCQDRLPPFAVPRYVEYLPELPKTPTAKVQRELLRAVGVTPATFDAGPRRRRRDQAGV
jgi:crotonobetaine/carnitine-CoA ligase